MSAGQQVQMDMIDLLSAEFVAVGHRAEALLGDVQFGGDGDGGGLDFSEQQGLIDHIVEGGEMFFGNDENVVGRLRVDVPKSVDVIVAINLGAGNVAGNDFTE